MEKMPNHEASRLLQYSSYTDRQPSNDAANISTSIPKKYRGTFTDHDNMKALGKVQVLRRNFRLLEMIGFASSVMVMWETFIIVSGLGLSMGGRAPVFLGLIYGAVSMICVYLTIAEMATIAPTAGGQYHWVSELAPARVQSFLSYITGWLVSLGWVSYLTLVSFTAATTLQGLVVLNNPSYAPEPWHSTLMCWAVLLVAFLLNTALAPALPTIQLGFLFLHISGWLSICIVLLAMGPRAHGYESFAVFENNAEWPTVGLSVVITMANSAALYVGYESPVHMSEEVQDASKVVPRVINWSLTANIAMMIAICGIYITAIDDLDTVLSSPTGVSFIQVLYNVTGSKAGTSVLAYTVIVEMISACTSEGTCASRQIWSSARDNGLPGSSCLVKVSDRFNIPVNAIVTTILLVALISLINIGSTAALNAINSLGGIFATRYLPYRGWMLYMESHDA